MISWEELNTGRGPIYPVELERCRASIRIGQQVRMNVREQDEDFRIRNREETCTVQEKYPHLLVAHDRRGRRRTVTYVELLVRERKRGEEE